MLQKKKICKKSFRKKRQQFFGMIRLVFILSYNLLSFLLDFRFVLSGKLSINK